MNSTGRAPRKRFDEQLKSTQIIRSPINDWACTLISSAFHEAEQELEIARQIDPLSPQVSWSFALMYS